jgi:hypothetical protein
VYNAHLEVVLASIAASSDGKKPSSEEDTPTKYVTFGGPTGAKVASQAEETELRQRVSSIMAQGKETAN